MGRQYLPLEWTDYGARFAGGRLFLAEWKQGFDIHHLRAMFFECQQHRAMKQEIAVLRRDLDTLQSQLENAERRAQFYRRQCSNEARLGLSLSRIFD